MKERKRGVFGNRTTEGLKEKGEGVVCDATTGSISCHYSCREIEESGKCQLPTGQLTGWIRCAKWSYFGETQSNIFCTGAQVKSWVSPDGQKCSF